MAAPRKQLLLLMLMATAPGCGSGDGAPGIVGDWFSCTRPDCSEIGVKGSRFQQDGTMLHLYPEKSVLAAAGGYCKTTNPDLNRTYTYDGSSDLVVTEKSGAAKSYLFVFADDIARLTFEGKTEAMRRVSPPRDRGPCSARTPWICPAAKMDGDASSCQTRWVCDGGSHEVKCTKNSGMYQCTCLAPGSAKKLFKSAGLCTRLDLKSLVGEINTACAWKLSLP